MKYIIEEVVTAEVEAGSAQEAIERYLSAPSQDAFCVEVNERQMFDADGNGPLDYDETTPACQGAR